MKTPIDIDYDTHYAKHCARYYGWLPATKTYQEQIGSDTLKYFTLCARQAIDVFMFEREGLLNRDANGKLGNVVICEQEREHASEIFNLVRPPLEEAILVGPLEQILTFRDTPATKGRSADEYVKDRELRRLLRLKGLSERAKAYFPFHIINFDPYGNLLSPDQEDNPLYQALERVFELQKGVDTFLLFVTTPIFHVHSDTEARLKRDLESNASSHEDIRNALVSSFGTAEYDSIDRKTRVAIGFAKSLVMSAAKKSGWHHKHHGVFVYERGGGGKMVSSVVQFSKELGSSNQTSYVDDVIRVIKNKPKYYSRQTSEKDTVVRKHLNKVTQYREKTRLEYLQQS